MSNDEDVTPRELPVGFVPHPPSPEIERVRLGILRAQRLRDFFAAASTDLEERLQAYLGEDIWSDFDIAIGPSIPRWLLDEGENEVDRAAAIEAWKRAHPETEDERFERVVREMKERETSPAHVLSDECSPTLERINAVWNIADGKMRENTRRRLRFLEAIDQACERLQAGELTSDRDAAVAAVRQFVGEYPEEGLRLAWSDWIAAIRTWARGRGKPPKGAPEPWLGSKTAGSKAKAGYPRERWAFLAVLVRRAGLGRISADKLKAAWLDAKRKWGRPRGV